MPVDAKNEAFHRLAVKRSETITDAIRVFGNLSSPNYVWTADEVLSYAKQINDAVASTLGRFEEAKCWRTNPPSGGEEVSRVVIPEPADDSGEVDESTDPGTDDEPVDPIVHRKMKVIEIIREANDDKEALAEMVAMQRQVIDDLRSKLHDT